MTFLVTTGNSIWNLQYIFNHQPEPRFEIAMNINLAFLGSKLSNLFRFQNFNLSSITVFRNGFPFAGTLLASDNDKNLYWNSLEALAFSHHGHGIPFTQFANHYFMVIDLTSTQQALHDFLYPELTIT